MSATNILITGGTGFVGSAIVNALQERHPDWRLTVFDLNHPAIPKANVEYLIGDVTEAKDVDNALRKTNPRVVIHTAGLVPPLPVRYNRKVEVQVLKVNVEGTRNILNAAKESAVDAFVYTSSCCCVTDNMSIQYPNIDESWPVSYQSLVYGESKAAAEALVLAASDDKMATCTLRPSVLFGPDDYQLIPSIHSCIAKRESPWVIGSGLNLWDVTYVTNVADAHILAAENLLTSRTAAGQAFFISNEEPVPFRVLCLAIWAHFGHYPPFEFNVPEGLAWFTGYIAERVAWLTGTPVTLSAGSVKDACSIRYCDGRKARRILGYVPRVGLEEGIRISCEAYAAKFKREALEKDGKANAQPEKISNGFPPKA